MAKSTSKSLRTTRSRSAAAVKNATIKKPKIGPPKRRQVEVVVPIRKTQRAPSEELDSSADESAADQMDMADDVDDASSEEEDSSPLANRRSCGKLSGKLMRASSESDAFENAPESSQTVVEDVSSDDDPFIFLNDKPKVKTVKKETTGFVGKQEYGIPEHLCDPLLRNTINKGLPQLLSGCSNISWMVKREAEGPEENLGMIKFGRVTQRFSDLDIPYIKSLISFDGDVKLNLVNLSRFDPVALVFKAPFGVKNDKFKYVTHIGQTKPALCFTVGILVDDFSKEKVGNAGGISSKFVTAIPLSYEYERWVACTAMVLNARAFKSQITDNKLVFSTLPDTGNKTTAINPVSAAVGKCDMAGSTQSPATIKSSASSSERFRYVLDADDDIPVLDARGVKMKLPKSLPQVPNRLPPFNGPIPRFSLVLIAHSTCAYQRGPSDAMKTVALNALWVTVLDCPDEKSLDISEEMWHDGPVRRSLSMLVPGAPWV